MYVQGKIVDERRKVRGSCEVERKPASSVRLSEGHGPRTLM